MLCDISEYDYNLMINNDVTSAYIIVLKRFSSYMDVDMIKFCSVYRLLAPSAFQKSVASA